MRRAGRSPVAAETFFHSQGQILVSDSAREKDEDITHEGQLWGIECSWREGGLRFRARGLFRGAEGGGGAGEERGTEGRGKVALGGAFLQGRLTEGRRAVYIAGNT